jgi:hypothetical protein
MGLYDHNPYAKSPQDGAIDFIMDSGSELGNHSETGPSCNESNISVTKSFNRERGELRLCGVRLELPGFNFESETNVTLTQVSKDGFLHNTQAMGPIFSITKTTPDGQRAKWTKPARVELTFKPFDKTIALERLRVAYWQPLSVIWIAIPDSVYDPLTGVLSAEVVELEVESFEFSAFVKCEEKSVCPPNQSCYSNTCQ